MSYILSYHPKIEDDIQSLPVNIQKRIEGSIKNRLTEKPEKYGTPLKGTLKGYWKIRVGDYRIVYKIIANEIYILGIAHRRIIYTNIFKRIN